MHENITLAAITVALCFGGAVSAGAQTATSMPADQTPGASAPHVTDFTETRRVLANSNLCDCYRTGGITWEYAGQQTVADWTAATQAVTGDGALMQLVLASFLVKFLTHEGDLVANFFGGWGTTAAAAEASDRRWIMTELMAEYGAGEARRLARAEGFDCAIPSLKLGT